MEKSSLRLRETWKFMIAASTANPDNSILYTESIWGPLYFRFSSTPFASITSAPRRTLTITSSPGFLDRSA